MSKIYKSPGYNVTHSLLAKYAKKHGITFEEAKAEHQESVRQHEERLKQQKQ